MIKHGNINALKHLFVETSQQLIKYAYRISHDNFIAEEVVQDTFLNLWNNRENILITGSVKAYLYQSVHNQTINKLKQKTNQHNSIGMLVSDDTWQYLEEYSQINENVISKTGSRRLRKNY
ncbi:MAG: sigma-70 family RNA polymerase sigma factor [Bacteroidetes bacterium]|nr:sigma-70 family RNA polymerase sigma factor [Bacteroidota bacterium]